MSLKVENRCAEECDFILDEETKIITPKLNAKTECRGLGYEFFTMMKKFKDNIYQYNTDTGESQTFEEILEKAIRVALNLKDMNVKKDDIICVVSYDHSHNSLPVLASLFLNVKFTALDITWQFLNAVERLKLIKPRICFVAPEYVEFTINALKEAGQETDIFVYDNLESFHKEELKSLTNKDLTPFGALLEPHENEDSFVPKEIDGSDVCSIFFTSGSTGVPKGACITSNGLFHNTITVRKIYMDDALSQKSVNFLIYSDFSWVSTMMGFTGCIANGSARIICKSFDAEQFWQIVDKYKVNYVVLSSRQANDVIAGGRPDNIDTSNLSLLFTGGGNFPSEGIYKLRSLFPGTLIGQAYGSTETCTILRHNFKKKTDILDIINRPECCGKPTIGYQYKVTDPDTERPCNPNEKGELRVKSDYLFTGYYKIDSSDYFDEDGFFKTGDLVYFDEQFRFYFVDRISQLLMYKEAKVFPSLIEQVLQVHPAVERVAVIGVPHETDECHPLALIVVRAGYEITEENLKEFANKQLDDDHQLRGGVRFVEAIPVTSSDKLKRAQITEMFLK